MADDEGLGDDVIDDDGFDGADGDVDGGPDGEGPDEADIDDGGLDDFSAAFRLRSGYNTNFDEEDEPIGSAFVEGSAEFEVERTLGGTDVYGSGDVRVIELFDLDLRTRFDGSAAFGARREIADGLSLDAALAAALDGDASEVTLERSAAAGLQLARPGFALALRGGAFADELLVDLSDEDTSEDRDGDLQRLSLEGTLLLRPQARVSPVISARAERVTFRGDLALFDEDDDPLPSLDRDADDFTIAAGLRLRPDETISLTVAGILNHREFDAGVDPLTLGFVDVEALWAITQEVELALSATREITEPDVDGSLAQDVRSFAASIGYFPATGIGASAEAGYARLSEYPAPGLDARGETEEFFGSLGLSYEGEGSLSAAISLTHVQTRDLLEDTDTRGTEISGTAQLSF